MKLKNVIIKSFQKSKDSAADEILNYLKGGSNPISLEGIMLKKKKDGGLYDYAENLKEDYLKSGNKVDVGVRKIFSEMEGEFQRDIKNGLKVIEVLQLLGFHREEIVSLLQFEDLRGWQKIFKRLKDGEEFQKKRSNRLAQLDKLIKENDLYMENLRKEIENDKKNFSQDFFRDAYFRIINFFMRKSGVKKEDMTRTASLRDGVLRNKRLAADKNKIIQLEKLLNN